MVTVDIRLTIDKKVGSRVASTLGLRTYPRRGERNSVSIYGESFSPDDLRRLADAIEGDTHAAT